MQSRSFAVRRHPPRGHSPAARRGFTLAEMLVALVLLAWGALALVAASAGAVRVVAAAEAQERATIAARERVEQLAARPCSGLDDGMAVDSSLGLREHWTISRTRNGARLATDTVEYTDHGAPHSVALERLVLC
jgi:prepilin-type N-terminal cleavage/methylation domain-containing protein